MVQELPLYDVAHRGDLQYISRPEVRQPLALLQLLYLLSLQHLCGKPAAEQQGGPTAFNSNTAATKAVHTCMRWRALFWCVFLFSSWLVDVQGAAKGRLLTPAAAAAASASAGAVA